MRLKNTNARVSYHFDGCDCASYADPNVWGDVYIPDECGQHPGSMVVAPGWTDIEGDA